MTVIVGTVEQAVEAGSRRRFDEGPFRGTADYLFETAPGQPPGPQALIARQAPGWALNTHFHMQHQFQVVLSGTGMLGRHPLTPGCVHYTSPQSGYGPLVAGPRGLDYFTLRVLTDKGAWYLPEHRQMMEPGLPKEHVWGVQPMAEVSNQDLIPLRNDGLGAWMLRARPGRTLACEVSSSRSGRFHVVLSGAFELSGRPLPEGTCVYAPAQDSPPSFVATQPSSTMVVVQFPHAACEHHVPESLRIAPSPRGHPVPAS